MTKCAVLDCESPREKREWCGKHYLRWRKYGDPIYLLPRFTVCRIDGCSSVPRSALSGLCEMHYYRLRRTGSTATRIPVRQPTATYRAAHSRVSRDKGPARSHQCVDCGRQAHHWSYTHSDPNESYSPGGQPYSLDPTYYEPRCAPCHAVFDGTGANQYTVSP